MKLSLELDVKNIDGNKSLNDILSTLTLEDKKELAKSIYTKVLTDQNTLIEANDALANAEIELKGLSKNSYDADSIRRAYKNKAIDLRKEILNNFVQFVAKDFKEEFAKEMHVNFVIELQKELIKKIPEITSDTYAKLLSHVITSAFSNSQLNATQIPWLQDTVNKISQTLASKGMYL